jgi:adenylate cyclase
LGDAEVAQSPEFLRFAAAQAAFLAAYRRLDFGAANLALDAAQAAAPPRLFGLYELYAERLEAMRAEPPVAGWDGVFEARQK